MADTRFERPCVHVALLPGVPAELYRWVEIGAEEEGVPCRLVQGGEGDVLAEAYAAAHSSRFQVGVAVSDRAVVLHEMHMPPQQAVLSFTLNGNTGHACRVMGANAARMVVHRPLHIDLTLPAVPPPPERKTRPAPAPVVSNTLPEASASPAAPTAEEPLDIEFVTRVIVTVVRILQERGVA